MPEPVVIHRSLLVQSDPDASLIYYVESEATEVGPGETWLDHAYTVDLEILPVEHNGRMVRNGGCSCPRFEYRLRKRVEAGECVRCKHIDAAMECLAEDEAIRKSNDRKGIPVTRRHSIFT